MKQMVDMAHVLLESKLNEQSICVDFTMGNGFDTLFFAKTCQHVFAFDIQQQAYDHTKDLLEKNGVLDKATLILDGHQNCTHYITRYDLGIFNLGYLPNKDHIVTTLTKTTLEALRYALDYLKKDGRLVIVCYPGHEEGKQESQEVSNFCKHLDSHDYHVASIKMENKKNAPYIIFIDKNY